MLFIATLHIAILRQKTRSLRFLLHEEANCKQMPHYLSNSCEMIMPSSRRKALFFPTQRPSYLLDAFQARHEHRCLGQMEMMLVRRQLEHILLRYLSHSSKLFSCLSSNRTGHQKNFGLKPWQIDSLLLGNVVFAAADLSILSGCILR